MILVMKAIITTDHQKPLLEIGERPPPLPTAIQETHSAKINF